MIDLSQVREHDEVVGADGGHIGTVDHTVDNAIKLTRKDSADNRHHYIDVGLISSLEAGKVRLKADTADAITFVESEEADRREESRALSD